MITALEKGYPLDYEINTRSPYQSKYIVGVGRRLGLRGPTALVPAQRQRRA